LLRQALRAINDEVAQLEGSAKITILFPMNTDATTVTPAQPPSWVRDSPRIASTDKTPAKNDAQRQLMAELGFRQEYFEQVMAYAPLASSRHGARTSSADKTRPDPAGLFASATPGDKA
jgi:hypothetical protein